MKRTLFAAPTLRKTKYIRRSAAWTSIIVRVKKYCIILKEMRPNMKNFHWLFCLGCICALFAACHDDDESMGGSADLFVGNARTIVLQQQAEGFHSPEYTLNIKAEDGSVFTRSGEHVRLANKSVFTLQTGLKKGVYRLLALKYPHVDIATSDTTWEEFGLGCRIDVSEAGEIKVIDHYDTFLQVSGQGTAKDPYIVSSSDHLKRLRNIINDQQNNKNVTSHTHFRQEGDIDMYMASFKSDHDYGWYPIGSQPTNPFRGVYDGNGYSIKNLWCKRPNASGIGLFGFVEQAYIKNVKMVNPEMEGMYAVGSIVGGCVTAGDRADTTVISSCTTKQGYVAGSTGSVGNGGIVGVVDMKGVLLMDSCINDNTPVSGDYAVGGLLGAGSLFSYTNVQQSENKASVNSLHTGAGGIVGSVDSLYILACSNSGSITGAASYNLSEKNAGGFGVGGLAGGTGISFIYASANTGNVKGHTGVGGIIGSTRIGSEELLFNNTLVKGCSNTGNVEGQTSVGGICGEAQFGGYQVYNTGSVTAKASKAYVGGIAGNTSIAVTHNVINKGAVEAQSGHCAGGIIGKATWGAIFACQNYGDVNVSAEYAGGVVGLAGNYTMVNYCSNMAKIYNSGKGPTGGIIGEIGDPREWSAMDILSCVLGSMECVLGVAGPCIAVAGKALQGAEGGAALAMSKLTHVLHIPETVADWSLIVTDAGLLGRGVFGMVTEEEIRLMKSSLKAKATDNVAKVQKAMNDIREGYSWSGSLMAYGLTTSVSSQYLENTKKLLDFYEASEENNAIVNYNINHKREERYEEIEKTKRIKGIVQKSIAGACCLGGTIVGFVSMAFTAGSTAALAAASIGGFITVVGGTNAIVETATDYQNNAVVVSQCLNVGEINVGNVDKVGGILGHAQQYCEINDCLNTGPFAGEKSTSTGGIVGRADSRSSIHNCLTVGSNWYAVMSSHGSFVSLKNSFYYDPNNHYYVEYGTKISLDDLCKEESYPGWSFTGDCPKWQVTNAKGYFPMPCHSEMEEAVEE